MNDKLTAILALGIGVVIGVNWPRIMKYIKPPLKRASNEIGKAYGKVLYLAASEKERLGDFMSRRQTRKKKTTTRKKTARRKVASATA